MRWKSFFDIVHFNPSWIVSAFPKKTIDKDLQKVPHKVIGTLGVGPWYFVQGAFLADYEDCVYFSDVVLLAGPDNQEICNNMKKHVFPYNKCIIVA